MQRRQITNFSTNFTFREKFANFNELYNGYERTEQLWDWRRSLLVPFLRSNPSTLHHGRGRLDASQSRLGARYWQLDNSLYNGWCTVT